MRYVALLRGINVGGKRKVEMVRLRGLMEKSGYLHVETYLNSGNVLFDSEESQDKLQGEIPLLLEKEFLFPIPALIKSLDEMRTVDAAIPEEWQNNKEQKTDVAYLFPGLDSHTVVRGLPWKEEYINIRLLPGAIIWNIERSNLNKSQLSKIVSQKVYQSMTVRNVNTARKLAEN
ncbi:MAG: DUF1697 domain-containing protein [Spirochaetales bacterium]|nr:DUF1697 domain-containing protein [Spirochaetales bacterium]